MKEERRSRKKNGGGGRGRGGGYENPYNNPYHGGQGGGEPSSLRRSPRRHLLRVVCCLPAAIALPPSLHRRLPVRRKHPQRSEPPCHAHQSFFICCVRAGPLFEVFSAGWVECWCGVGGVALACWGRACRQGVSLLGVRPPDRNHCPQLGGFPILPRLRSGG